MKLRFALQVALVVLGLSTGLILSTMAGSDEAPTRQLTVDVEADKLRTLKIYVTAPVDKLKGDTTPFKFIATDKEGQERSDYDASFKAPAK